MTALFAALPIAWLFALILLRLWRHTAPGAALLLAYTVLWLAPLLPLAALMAKHLPAAESFQACVSACLASFGPALWAALIHYALLTALSAGALFRLYRCVSARRGFAALPVDPEGSRSLSRRFGLPVKLLPTERHLIFTEGLLRPVVVVSGGALQALGAGLPAAMAHEAAHVRRRDPLRLALAGFLSDALWLLPGVKQLLRRFRLNIEIAADSAATGGTPDRDYTRMLVRASRRESSLAPALSSAESLSERVNALLRGAPKPRVWPLFLTAFIGLGLLATGASFTAPSDCPLHRVQC